MIRDTEGLRPALLEIEHLRAREARARRENALLLRLLESVRARKCFDLIVDDVLRLLLEDIGADVVMIVSVSKPAGRAIITYSTAPALLEGTWQPAETLFDRQRYFSNLHAARAHSSWPKNLRSFASWISAPLCDASGAQEALVCLSKTPGFAGPEEVKRFGLAASLLSQVFRTERLESQNRSLARLLSGERFKQQSLSITNSNLGFEAIDAALRNLTVAQSEVVEILDDLLRVEVRKIDDSIKEALPKFCHALRLASIGIYAKGRTEVFERLYGWNASRSDKDEVPVGSLIERFAEQLREGEAFSLTLENRISSTTCGDDKIAQDVLSPFSSDDGVVGFVHAVRGVRETMLEGELSLHRSLASVVGSLLARKENEVKVATSRSELELHTFRLHSTLNALPDLVVELDADGRLISFYSDKMSGLVDDPASFIGLRPEDALPASVAVRIRRVLQRVKSGESSAQAEFFLHLRDQRRWFSLVATARSPEVLECGDGFLAVVRDVTEEKQRLEEIERLGAIARRTSNLVIVTNASREIVWVNEAFERRTGYKLNEVLGLRPGSLLQGDQTDSLTKNAIKSALDSGHGIQCEILNYDRNGTPYWVEMDIQPTRDASGRISGYMAVQADITERRQRLDNLVLSEKRARADLVTATDASRDGIAVTDAEGLFVYMNTAHRDMFAVPAEFDIIGKPWAVLYSDDKAQFINDKVFPILVAKGGWKGEITGRRFDGTLVEQEVSLTLKDDGGIVCITRDIGERLKAEAERTRLQEALQLAQRREALSQMAAGLAHDFNNLIAAIAGSAALIETDAEGATAEHARRIQLATQRASGLVQRLLARGARSPAKQSIMIDAIIREAADLIRAGLRSGTQLRIDVSSPDLIAEVDPTDVLQVLLNLALNARDALDQNQNSPQISISARWARPDDLIARPEVGAFEAGANYLLLEIADNGCGMDVRDRARIFEPYFTTKGDGGSGLGLVIVSSIVDAISGALVVDSSPGIGTSVKVFWPKTPINRSVDLQTFESANKAIANLDGNSVLLVDDNEDVLDVLTIFFEKAGAEVAAVSDPTVALEAFREDPEAWDLLLTDFDMPGMTGAELARGAKAVRPHIPVILMTGFPDWRSRTSVGIDKLFERIVSKPLAPEDVIALVACTLRETLK